MALAGLSLKSDLTIYEDDGYYMISPIFPLNKTYRDEFSDSESRSIGSVHLLQRDPKWLLP